MRGYNKVMDLKMKILRKNGWKMKKYFYHSKIEQKAMCRDYGQFTQDWTY